MKKIYIIILACLVYCGSCIAQQLPHYTQYVLNNYVLNPAVTGIENYIDLKTSVRDQWVGLDGAPRTAYLTMHGPIGKKDYKTSATSFEMEGENPRGKAYWENYTASSPHHGIGITMMNDRTGNFNRVTMNASYAYHMGLSSRTNLSAGFGAGFTSVSRAHDRSFYGDDMTQDPAETNADIIGFKPDLSAGVWLYSANYFAGVSMQQIIPAKRKVKSELGDNNAKLLPHIFITTGYRFFVSEDVFALPSIMVKHVSATTQFDLNVKLQYRAVTWIGASYRNGEGYAAMAGVNISHKLNIGYSYDYTTSALNTASRGTHEIMVGFLIGNKFGDWCPRNVW